ncbi:MAG: hypothetical protein Q8R01_09335 [Ramlibacter sp.]|nr:hypothetical protein [Ramlibacter sp.]
MGETGWRSLYPGADKAASVLMSMALHSYVVRYDSGFAPNPYYGFCTLATCKPKIRAAAQVDDWVVGSGSGAEGVRRAGYLVYAMRVTETLTWDQYAADVRFQRKRPFRRGSRKQTCGDNIYFRAHPGAAWQQRDSFHSLSDGSADAEHIAIDTSVDRVLVSEDFLYLGGTGPLIPDWLHDSRGRQLCKQGIGHSKFEEPQLIADFVAWIRSAEISGYQGLPQEWLALRQESV